MVVEIEFTRPGKGVTIFSERLVMDTPQVKVLLLEQHQSDTIHHDNQLILGKRAPVVWFVFPNQWYAVGRFHTTNGNFTGWYTNFCTPFTIRGTKWSTTDLFLDFWQPTNGEAHWLDEDEFHVAVMSDLVNTEQQKRIQHEKTVISDASAVGNWPPPIAKRIDLASVLNKLLSPTPDDLPV